jgi:hypothetical protein
MIMVRIIAVCSKPILLVVVRVAWYTLIGMDLLDKCSLILRRVVHVFRGIYNGVSQ